MENTSSWAKINFLTCLVEEWSPYSLSQLWTWFQLGTEFLRLLSGGNINILQIVTGGHRCSSTRCKRGCFEFNDCFHKNFKYWNSWYRFFLKKQNKKQWSKITESLISTYLINVKVWKKALQNCWRQNKSVGRRNTDGSS